MHASLCDFVLDIVQNSHEAGASLIHLDFFEEGADFRVRVEDNGKGMDEETRKRALDPFYTDGRKHAHRKFGLGLPFLVQAIELSDGDFALDSRPGEGTTVSFRFDLGNVDTPPLGEPVTLFMALLTMDGDYELGIARKRTGHAGQGVNSGGELDYGLSRSELREALGGEFNAASTLVLLKEFLESQES